LEAVTHGEEAVTIPFQQKSKLMAKSNKIPVTIITGFLGAGKTTLLNRLIADHPEKKFAIIENEFGDIPIDQELVVNAKDGIFEMSNGCICCSLNVELGELLQKLMSDAYEFNHLIIETTGIAEPDGIASAFIGGNKSSKFVLDGTVCLADAQDIVLNLDERGEATKQISFADLILLNKTDLVTKEQLIEIKTRIKKQNAEAPILEGSFGKIEKDVLKLNAYDGNSLENKFLNPHHHHHHNELVAHSFEFGEALLADKFEHWITMLLFLSGYQIYRIKGILNFEGETHKVIFQSVRSNSKIEIGSLWIEGEIRKSKIVFIGNNVKKEALDKGLKGCLKK
jgi:G3E family GTPase